MTTAVAPPAPRRRFTLRYSLRVLLLAFTAFAIGFPIWYRWPYQEVELRYPESNAKPDTSQPPFGREITTWQRQWGGGRLKHGLSTTVWNANGQRVEATYRLGKRDGPRTCYTGDGRVEWIGHYKDDVKCSETLYHPDGSVATKMEFLDGKLLCADQYLADGEIVRYRVSQGRVTDVNGEPLESLLFKRMDKGSVDAHTAKRLRRVVGQEFGDTLKDVLEWLGSESGVRVVAHEQTASVKGTIFHPQGIDLASALVLAARGAGCQCDYRDGLVWVLPNIGDGDRIDRTLASYVQPREGTELAAAWRQSVGKTGSAGPPAKRLEALASTFGLAIEM